MYPLISLLNRSTDLRHTRTLTLLHTHLLINPDTRLLTDTTHLRTHHFGFLCCFGERV